MQFRSLLLLLLPALVPLSARAATYSDPQGRYNVQAPPGSIATPLDASSVQIASGSGYVTVVAGSGDPASLLSSVARQIGTQWRAFTEARRGAARLAGRAGPP